MAVVGEARIVVRAITTGVADEITRALKQAQANVQKEGEALGERLSDGFSRGFGKKKKGIFGDLFDKDQAEAARAKFASLQKAGMTMQTAFGVLAGSIGSLVVSLGALVGSAGAAASALVAVAGAGIGAGIGMKLAGMALSGVTGPLKAVDSAGGKTRKTIAELREEMQQLRFDSEEAALSEKEAALNLEKARENLARVQDLPPNSMARREAELSYEQADLALRRAIDRNNDLQEEIKNGPKQDSGAGNDPYKGLTESQKDFAKTLVKLKPKFDDLKEAVAKGFLPILGDQINTLFTTNFPTLLRMFTGIGKALGDATDKVFGFINSTDGMALFESLFKESEGVIKDLGETLALTLESLLIVLKEAAPITQAFTGWLKDSATTFNKYVKGVAGNGDMKKFFEDAGRVAADFGDIFGNIFGGIKDLIADSLNLDSGGDDLIQWLKGVTANFASIGENPGFSKFLKDSAANAIKMFDALGDVFGIILGMADDPAIGEFWDTIAKAADPLKELLENGAAAGDELADLIVQVTEIAAAFGDSGQLEAFFGTLRDIAKATADFLNQENVKAFLGWFGPIAGTFLAFGTALKVASFGFKVMLGTFNMFTAPFRFFFEKDVKSGMTKFDALKNKTKDTFKNMKDFAIKAKEGIKTAFTAIKDAGKAVWSTVKDAANYAWTETKRYANIAKEGISKAFTAIKDAGSKAFTAVKDAGSKAFTAVKDSAKYVYDQGKLGFKLLADKAKSAATVVGTNLKNAYTAVKDSAKVAFDQAKIGFRLLADKAKTAAIAVGTGLKTAFVNTAASAKVLATNIGTATVAMFKQGIQSAKNVAVMIAQRAATIGAAIAQGVLRVATVIGTAVQAAFNFVLALNPITLIVIAIVALVAALIWFFTQTEIGKQIWQGFMDFMAGAFEALMAAFRAVGDFFVAVWNGLIAGLTAIFNFIWGIIQGYIDIWIGIFQFAIDLIIGIWNGLVDGISAAIGWVVGVFQGAWEGVSRFFTGFVNGLIGMFENFVNFVINALNNFLAPLRNAVGAIADALGIEFTIGVIPNVRLPRLAKGGVVSPSAGGSLVNVAEAGKPERIEPLDENGMSKRDKVLLEAMSRGGGSGVNITVNPSAGMDEVELSNLVSRQLAFQLRAGGAY